MSDRMGAAGAGHSQRGRILDALLPLLATLAALAVGAVMLILLKANPNQAYGAMWEGAFGSSNAVAETLVKATPLLLVGLGICIAFRGGVINIGGEGRYIVGALLVGANELQRAIQVPAALLNGLVVVLVVSSEIWKQRRARVPRGPEAASAGFYVVHTAGNLWLGLLRALAVGAAMGLAMAFISVTLRAQQGNSGIGVYLFGLGLSELLLQKLVGSVATVSGFRSVRIPILSSIPVVGDVFFSHSLLAYGAFLLVPVAWFALNKTTFGLKIRAVGENPEAADSLGVSVARARYTTLTLGGALSGVAGASLSIALLNVFQQNLTNSLGFIAVALVYFGGWRPWGLLAVAQHGGPMVNVEHLVKLVRYEDQRMPLAGHLAQRDARVVGSRPTGRTSKAGLARMMVGRDLASGGERGAVQAGQVRLRLQSASALSDRGTPALRQVSLELRAGEILGLAGVSGNGQRELSRRLVQDFHVKTPSIETPLKSLSGGNVQKVILARELARRPEVLVAAQPARGLDIGAAESVHQRLLEQREAGTATLLISEDLDEILALSDRITVIYEGQIRGEMGREQASPDGLGLLMAGVRS